MLVCFSVHLVFDGHCHQVVELVHAVGVEPHDGGVGELVKHGLQHLDQGDSIKINRITKGRFISIFINIIIMSDTLRLWMGWCFWKISSMKRRLNIHRSSRWLLGILWENPLHMVKATYHGKNHGIWISPCNGLFHGTMAKPMGVIRGNIHGFCQSPLDFVMDHPETTPKIIFKLNLVMDIVDMVMVKQ